MPISTSFSERLDRVAPLIAERIGTPYYIYDEVGICDEYEQLCCAFGHWPYRQHFAVKALPNPAIVCLLHARGSGFDCSSPLELAMVDQCSVPGSDIIFTSNNTAKSELDIAISLGARITFDDFRYFERLKCLPEVVTFRLAPGGNSGSTLMGTNIDSKFGMCPADLCAAYAAARQRGAQRFGIYGMACANELMTDVAIAEAERLLSVARDIESKVGLEFEDINLGGGIGIPYRPEEKPFDRILYAQTLIKLVQTSFPGRTVPILTELGRSITGPHGVLVTRVVSRTRKRREIIGVDASMAALIRPALYGAYHHITVPFSGNSCFAHADVVGSMCENADRLTCDRLMELPEEGDLLYVHDVGAHAHAMGMTYNGRLRPAEILLRTDGRCDLIRRAELIGDYLRTVTNEPIIVAPNSVAIAGLEAQ